MKRQNLMKEYDITHEDLEKGIQLVSVNLGKIESSQVMCAIADLLANGDIGDDINIEVSELRCEGTV